MEKQAAGFAGEVTAIQASSVVSVTDAICRMPRLRRAFTAEADLIRARVQQLEAREAPDGVCVTRRVLRWFWGVVMLLSLAAFAAGYAVSALH